MSTTANDVRAGIGPHIGEAPTYADVHRERVRAHRKHAEKGSMELKSWDDPVWLPVLTEEVGEVARVLCEQALGNISDGEAVAAKLREELVQVAAMSCAWIDAIDEAKSRESVVGRRAATEQETGQT